jgi:FSR family fosmidomycin resistance protein-like MFS transporter
MPSNQASHVPAVEKAPQIKSTEGSFQTLKALTVSSAHAVHDTYAGFIAPLLPYLIEKLALLKVEAGMFLLFYQGASILQPIIGHLGDKTNLRKYALLMPALTGISLSLLGVTPSFTLALMLCLVAGISSATLHSVLPALVSSLSGKQMGKGMSFWIVGGEIGIMIGPVLVTSIVTTLGVQATTWLMIPGILVSVFLSLLLKNMPHHNLNTKISDKVPVKELSAIILPLAGFIAMRSILRTTTEIFLPVFLLEQGVNPLLAGSSVSMLLGFGVLGTLAGGSFKDRFGFRTVMIGSVTFSSLGMFVFTISRGIFQIVGLAIVGTASMMMLPIGLAYVQENFPNNRSLANGLYLAAMFGINAVAGVITGFLYDTFGGHNTFLWSGFINLFGIPFMFFLPNEKKQA